jgi:hypothetical protein
MVTLSTLRLPFWLFFHISALSALQVNVRTAREVAMAENIVLMEAAMPSQRSITSSSLTVEDINTGFRDDDNGSGYDVSNAL